MLESGSTGWQQHNWVGGPHAVACLSGSVILVVGEGKGVLGLWGDSILSWERSGLVGKGAARCQGT